MKTFCIQTLGCKVNHYESEQLAALLRDRGWVRATPERAHLRIIHTCSVTVQAASQSRQETRRMVRLPVLSDGPFSVPANPGAEPEEALPATVNREHPSVDPSGGKPLRPRVLVTGCWASSDKQEASSLAGVDAVLTHQDNLAAELDRLLTLWQSPEAQNQPSPAEPHACASKSSPGSMKQDGWMIEAGTAAGERTRDNKPDSTKDVNVLLGDRYGNIAPRPALHGANSLPLLGEHQTGRQRAFLKVQDGCDAHCTYCIIPRLRPALLSKPIQHAVEEATRLVASGHVEIVLTGIFLGAYGQETALRRRQSGAAGAPLARLVEALCTRVKGLGRLRLSSLEPGDLSDELLRVLRSHEQVMPHLHLPLQSGSDAILRRMNRQYRRDDFLRMLDRVNAAIDRPALTTDIIAGFPGETDEDFESTREVVDSARFIHIHAFPFSPRPGTAAARWTGEFVRGPVVNRRIDLLREMAAKFSFEFRSQLVGQIVQVIAERQRDPAGPGQGRCERHFAVMFDAQGVRPGELIRVRIDRVTPDSTFGTVRGGA